MVKEMLIIHIKEEGHNNITHLPIYKSGPTGILSQPFNLSFLVGQHAYFHYLRKNPSGRKVRTPARELERKKQK